MPQKPDESENGKAPKIQGNKKKKSKKKKSMRKTKKNLVRPLSRRRSSVRL